MDTLGDVLNRTLSDFGIQKAVKKYRALHIWEDVVGERIAKVTKAQRISDGRLFVKVKNDSWRNELVYYKKEIVNKINKEIGYTAIKDIILI
jgi:predicted nucleic acid-binding Zn ribbon protein